MDRGEGGARELAAQRLLAASGGDPSRLKAAYRVLAKRLHPDSGGDAEAFLGLKAAYETAFEILDRGRRDAASPLASSSPAPRPDPGVFEPWKIKGDEERLRFHLAELYAWASEAPDDIMQWEPGAYLTKDGGELWGIHLRRLAEVAPSLPSDRRLFAEIERLHQWLCSSYIVGMDGCLEELGGATIDAIAALLWRIGLPAHTAGVKDISSGSRHPPLSLGEALENFNTALAARGEAELAGLGAIKVRCRALVLALCEIEESGWR